MGSSIHPSCCWKLDPGAAVKPGKEELRCYRGRTAVRRPAASSTVGRGCVPCKKNRWPGSPAPALRCLSQRGRICGESRKESIWRRQQEHLDKIKKTKRMMSSIVSVLPGRFSPGDLFPFFVPPSFSPQVSFYRRIFVTWEVTGGLSCFVIIGHDLAH